MELIANHAHLSERFDPYLATRGVEPHASEWRNYLAYNKLEAQKIDNYLLGCGIVPPLDPERKET
jgi:hypothetical protein